MPAMRPNILFILSDQHRHDCAGYAGHPLIRTPHLDRLAREGMTFTHAGCNTPVCAPARQSLASGRWPVHHGGLTNFNVSELGAQPDIKQDWYPQLLRQAGYHSAHLGKWHVSGRFKPVDIGFDEFANPPKLKFKPPASGNSEMPPALPLVRPESFEEQHATRMTRLGQAFLKQAAEGNRPYFLTVNYEEPHPPYHACAPYAKMYAPENVEPWPNFPDELRGKPRQQRQMRKVWELEGKPWRGYWDRQAAGYLGLVSFIDAQVGELLGTLDETGLAARTLVIYSTDHGDMAGGHGMYDKHCNLYDDIVRVPLLARWPGVTPAGERFGGFVSNALDLASTFAELATGSAPESYAGRSLAPVLQGGDDRHPYRERLLASYHGGQFGLYSQRMYRDHAWKYVWNPTDEDELYDLAADPAQLNNRASHSACAEVLAEYRRKMWAEFSAIQDPLFRTVWAEHMLLGTGSL